MPDDNSKLKEDRIEDEEELDPLDDEGEEEPRTPRSLEDIDEEMQKPRKTFETAEPKVSQEDFKRNLGTFKSNIPGEHTLDDLAEEELPMKEDEDVELDIPNLRSKPFKEPPIQTGYSGRPNNYNNYANPSFGGGGRTSSKVHLIILAVVGLAVIGGTVFLLKSQFSDRLSPQPSPTPVVVEPSPTPTPSPTPEPLDRSKYTLRVLNGTTKAGLAASVSSKLKDLGFKIEKTGNASNQSLKQTIVKVKADQNELLAQIIKDLSPDYEATGSMDLKASDPSDSEISIGAK